MKSKPETWIDQRGQIVYIKYSKLNKSLRLTKHEFEATNMLLSGTVTRNDGKVFYAPFTLATEIKKLNS
jgi:hypothetical protein